MVGKAGHVSQIFKKRGMYFHVDILTCVTHILEVTYVYVLRRVYEDLSPRCSNFTATVKTPI